MTAEVLVKGFFSLLFSGLLAWMIWDRASGEGHENGRDGGREDRRDSGRENGLDGSLKAGPESGRGGRPRDLPYISGLLLPAFLSALWVLSLVLEGPEHAMENLLTFCFGVFLHICLYYLLLLPALPFLRRHISARACAVLWMLPNYLFLTQMRCMRLPAPRWVVEVPSPWVQILPAVWLVGFLAVFGWKIVSHLVFRARILRNARPVTDPAVLAVWQREREAAHFCRPELRPVVSPDLQTPLSVGLFRRSVCVVLPKRAYPPEALALIFRHELVHIGREDARDKFFLAFCCAMCWFNPLMWLAARKSSEDLELSCDETALFGSDANTRRRYAELLLQTAGQEQGFTTCLSASANALRYRLKNVLAAKKKPSGALVVGLVFFILCISCGEIALACGECTGAQAIYRCRPSEQYTVSSINAGDLVCTDEAALHRYFSALRMERISGNYTFVPGEASLQLIFDTPEGVLAVILSDRFLKLVPLYGERTGAEYFYLPDGASRDAVRAFAAAPGAPDGAGL